MLYKAIRVTLSALESEVMEFLEAFDMSHTITFDIQAISNQIVPLRMVTDRIPLLNVLTKAIITTSKRLMINFKAVNYSYQHMEINDIANLKYTYNTPDPFTKIRHDLIFLRVQQTSELYTPIRQWII